MAKNTSILLGDHFNEFINRQIASGKYSSASEVVRAALRMFEEEEMKKVDLLSALELGESSGYEEGIDPKALLNDIHKKYLNK